MTHQRGTKSLSAFFNLFCGCCTKSNAKAEILLEESHLHKERKTYTVIFGACPKGIGLDVQLTMQGPKITRVSAQKWNKIAQGDRLLSIGNENCVDSSVDVVKFLMLNLYDKTEAIFDISRNGQTMKIAISRHSNGFGFDFCKCEEDETYIVITDIMREQSNECRIGDKLLSINNIDASMINIEDLRSMLETPGNRTVITLERIISSEDNLQQ